MGDETSFEASPDIANPTIPDPVESSGPEVNAAPETEHRVSGERRTQEVRSLAANLLSTTAEVTQAELAGKTSEQQRQILQDQGKRKLDDYSYLLNVDPAQYTGDDRLSLDKGNPVVINREGQHFTILQIKDGTKDSFTCVVRGEDGNTADQVLTRQTVAMAQLISERATVAGLFSPDDQELLNAYFDYIETGTLREIPDIDQKIQEFAKAHDGILTENVVQQLAGMEFDNKEQILEILQNTNIVDEQVLKKLIAAKAPTALLKEPIDTLLRQLPEGIDTIKRSLASLTLPELFDSIQTLRPSENDSPEEKARKRKELEAAKSALAGSGGILALLLLVVVGELLESAANMK